MKDELSIQDLRDLAALAWEYSCNNCENYEELGLKYGKLSNRLRVMALTLEADQIFDTYRKELAKYESQQTT
jgi:hypothetical protein